jgi:uncharacterized protein (TIGR03067 family)
MSHGMIKTSVCLLFAVGSFVAFADDDASQVAPNLQGDWVGTQLELNGTKASDKDATAFRLAIKPDEISVMTCSGDRCIERRKKYKLDVTKSPMWLDLTSTDGE